jgi:hypothetical protein
MKGLTTLGVVAVAALMAPSFAVFASILTDLAIEVTGLLTVEADLSITLPTLAIALVLEAQVALTLAAAVSIGLPKLSLSLAFNAELALLLAIVLAIRAVLALGAVGGLELLTYGGTGSGLGAAVSSSGGLTSGNVTAVVLGATSSAAFAAMGWIFPGYGFAGLTVVGAITLAVACSGVFSFFADLGVEYGGRYAAELNASASIGLTPLTFAGDIQVCVKIAANIRAAIAAHMPEVGANVLAAVQAKLAVLASLAAQLDAAVSFATDGLDVFAYSGPGDGLGPALTSALSSGWPDGAPPSAPSQVVLLVATTPAATAALTAFFPGAAA